MENYIGTKRIKATPMNRLEYNDYRGWELPSDENGDDEGYLVEYIDGSQSNHHKHEGYISWSPKEVFEKAYYKTSGMTLARRKWNGKNMFIVYMPPLYLPPFNTTDTARKVNDRTAKWIGEDKPLDCQPYIAMYNAQQEWIPGWLASQSDMLDNDWYIVE